jgi:hypothetical protein
MSRTNEVKWLNDKQEKQEEKRIEEDTLRTLVEFFNVQLSSETKSLF